MTGLRRLLTGPAGSGKTHASLARIRDAATETGLRGRHVRAQARAMLVLPTYAQVRHTQRIALSRWNARAMIDAPFATFTSAGERFLTRFRVRALPTAVERDRLMAAALDAVDPTVFSKSGDAPGLRARLLRLVKDLKQSGRSGTALRDRLGETLGRLAPNAQDRTRDFVRVFAAYEDLLHAAGFEDHEDVLRRLAESLETADPARVPALLVVDGFDDFTAVEHRILDALTAHVVRAEGEVLVTLPYDAQRPELFAGSGPTRTRLLASGFREEALRTTPRYEDPALAALSTDLFGSVPAVPIATTAVQTILAGDPEDEAECVARAIRALARHRPNPDGRIPGWRQVGVVCRDIVHDAPRIQAALERLGVPVRTLHAGPALEHVPWVAALQGPLEILRGHVDAGRFSARRTRAWLRWCATARNDLPLRRALDEWEANHRRRADPTSWADFVGGAPEALAPDLASLTAATQALSEPRSMADGYAALGSWIERLAPLPQGGGLGPDGRVLDPARDLRRQQAAAARRRIQHMLEGLAASSGRMDADRSFDAADAIHALEQSWLDATLSVTDRRLDAVNLIDPHTARYWELEHVFVVGLAEGAFPIRPREDVLLRDADRDLLMDGDAGLALPKARDREIRERRLFYGAVTRARRHLWLSRPAYDRDGNPLQASVYWDVLHDYVAPTVAHESTRPGRLAWPEAWTFTHGDLIRLAATRVRTDPGFADAVLDRDLLRRARRDRRRMSEPIEDANVLRRFADSVSRVNVSVLNRARQCPYRHFARDILALRADELSFEDAAFGARDEGQALHAAFHMALAEPERSAESIAMTCALDTEAGPAERALLIHELCRAVDLLRERERETAGAFTPMARGLEYDFGKDADVWLGAGDQRFRLHGRVDRVDASGPEAIVLVDYKRSKGSVTSACKDAKAEQDLQLPLYARALEVSWGTHVFGLEWVAGLFRNRRAIWAASVAGDLARRREGVKPTVEPDAEFRSRLEHAEATAARTVAAVRAGDHARRPIDAKTCDRCDWLRLCRPDRRWLDAERAT